MKTKIFFITFFILLILELTIGIGNSYLQVKSIEFFGIELNSITSVLMFVFSMPMSLIRSDLPFYGGGFILSLVLTIFNIAIQALVLYKIFNLMKKK